MTLDAAEHMLLSIINSTRKNNDEAEFTELPDAFTIPVELADEFAPFPSEMEKQAYEYLGLSRRK